MTDNYKDEFKLRLKTSALYKALKKKCNDQDLDAITTVEAGVAYACQRAKAVMRHMGEYTLHDEDHLFNVLDLMGLILGSKNISKLSAPELMLLILSAFFHDLGMAPSEHEVQVWQLVWDTNPAVFETDEDSQAFGDFNRFLITREQENKAIETLTKGGELRRAATLKGYLISDYIRLTHAERAMQIIAKDRVLGEDRSSRIKFRTTDLTTELEKICFSHNVNAVALLDLDNAKPCGQGIYACLPLVGVVLRIADLLDFDGKRTPGVLFSHLNIKHPVSLGEWKKHRSVENWDIQLGAYVITAKCEHPAIEAAIREYCDYIDKEISVCHHVLSALNENKKVFRRGIVVKLPLAINRERVIANTDGSGRPLYTYRDTKFTLSQRQVVDLLMGMKLYGKPEVALRELLQNSLDACMARQALEKEWGNPYDPKVTVSLIDQDAGQILEVEDNGMGMDLEIIDKFYTKVGASFYKSAEFQKLLLDTGVDMKPRSRFGIGILSAFMVADTLEVDTKRITGSEQSSDAINLAVEGQDSIFWIRPGRRKKVGTTTRLQLKKGKNPWGKMTDDEFIQSVLTVIPNPPYPVTIVAGEKVVTRDERSFLSARPPVLDQRIWPPTENVRYLSFGFSGRGMNGSAIVAIVENDAGPVMELTVPGKTVVVEGNEYPLSKSYKMEQNQIAIKSTTIGLDRHGEIKTDNNAYGWIESVSAVSLHGIGVPADLFPASWRVSDNQVRLAWPFPIRLVVDVSSPMDLDLNSARSEILKTEKWTAFEEQLAFCVACGIKGSVGEGYWRAFLENIIVFGGGPILRKGFEWADSEEMKGERPAIVDLPEPLVEVEDPNLPLF